MQFLVSLVYKSRPKDHRPSVPWRYFRLSTTLTVNSTNESRAALAGNLSTNALASPANWRASCCVRSIPSLFMTNSRANSTSPGPLNLRRIRGPSSGFCSHANSDGAVARPKRRSAPLDGLPISSAAGRKSNVSSMSYVVSLDHYRDGLEPRYWRETCLESHA